MKKGMAVFGRALATCLLILTGIMLLVTMVINEGGALLLILFLTMFVVVWANSKSFYDVKKINDMQPLTEKEILYDFVPRPLLGISRYCFGVSAGCCGMMVFASNLLVDASFWQNAALILLILGAVLLLVIFLYILKRSKSEYNLKTYRCTKKYKIDNGETVQLRVEFGHIISKRQNIYDHAKKRSYLLCCYQSQGKNSRNL